MRTVVFVKGCPLRCPWCSNPETQNPAPELLLRLNLCIGCGTCVSACPEKTLEVRGDKVHLTKERCTACGACVDVCPTGALEMAGRIVDTESLAGELLRDAPFFRRSGGGVTFSGGEPLSQAEGCAEVAAKLKAVYVHTALETSGYGTWNQFEVLLPHIDLVLFDLKLMDSGEHLRVIGTDNRPILENAERVVSLGKDIIFRVPLIPGYTGTEENLARIADFVGKLAPETPVHLLPYHAYGSGKYGALDREYALSGAVTQTAEERESALSIFTARGIRAVVV